MFSLNSKKLVAMLFIAALVITISGEGADKTIYLDFSSYPDRPVKTRGILGWNSWGTDYEAGPQPGLKLLDKDSRLIAYFSFASLPKRAVLSITHSSSGYSPITISINKEPVVSNYDLASHQNAKIGYVTDTFHVTDLIKMGENTITWEAGNLNSPYYLKSFRIEAEGPARAKFSSAVHSAFKSRLILNAAPSTAGKGNAHLESALGFAVGGAKDIQNFRKNIEEGYLPLPTDIPYQGLFYDYYFHTGQKQPCDQLFCPSYSFAITRDPLSGELEYYLTVGLNSNLSAKTFKRKKLNLLVVIDISGSMSSPFNKYYYDKFGNKKQVTEWEGKTKMEAAKQALKALVGHLKPEDKLGIVLFNNKAYKLRRVTPVGEDEEKEISEDIDCIRAGGGTNLESGMYMATRMMDQFEDVDRAQYKNRVVLITDMMPNIGIISKSGLGQEMKYLAANGIYTSFVGVGVDFNTALTDAISEIKGANSFSIHSAKEFKEKMSKDFEYMVTPWCST